MLRKAFVLFTLVLMSVAMVSTTSAAGYQSCSIHLSQKAGVGYNTEATVDLTGGPVNSWDAGIVFQDDGGVWNFNTDGSGDAHVSTTHWFPAGTWTADLNLGGCTSNPITFGAGTPATSGVVQPAPEFYDCVLSNQPMALDNAKAKDLMVFNNAGMVRVTDDGQWIVIGPLRAAWFGKPIQLFWVGGGGTAIFELVKKDNCVYK